MTDSRSASDPYAELDRWTRIRVQAGGLLAALAMAMALVATHGALHQQLFDAYQRILPPPRPSDRIVVVVVDSPSLTELGAWPWSRYVMARLTEQIADRGASAIGFDFLFPERDRQTPDDFVKLYYELSPATAAEIRRQMSMDDIFARVIGRHPVVLARMGVDADSYDASEQAALPAPFPPEAQFVGARPSTIPAYPVAVTNLDMLDGAAAGHGLANGPTDPDGVVRRVPLLGRAGGVLTPSLALDLVRVADGQDAIHLEGDADGLTAISIDGHRVPVDADGRVALHFAASPPGPHGEKRSAYRTIPAVDLLRKGIPADALKGKIVLVGLAAAGTSDVVNTARDGRTYGVFVQAQTVDAILSGRSLKAPLWATITEWSLALAMVVLSIFGVPGAPISLVIVGAVGETLAVFGASVLAFQHNILLDPITMLAPGAASSAYTVAVLFVEGRRVQQRLRTALDDERLGAARISGELAAASEIQSGMLLPRHELARVSADVEIDALLQPARTVGGDLYDAFEFEDGRVCFLVGDVTGKGVPASLFMALAKALSRSFLVRRNTPLLEAMQGINAELSRDNGQAMAVSLLVGVLHPLDGRLELCSAGHENPLVVGADGVVRELRLDGGPPLCVDETYVYPIETHHLGPGEVLVAFTDGLTEAQDPGGRLFTREEVFEILSRAAQAPTISDAVDGIVAGVRAFEGGGEPSDDLTVLALRLRANGPLAGGRAA